MTVAEVSPITDSHRRSVPLTLKLSAAFVALVPLALALRSGSNLFNSPLVEDAYYSLTVARNIATGHGFTVDGTMLTNGVQPLVTVISSIVFLGSPPTDVSIRLLLILNWMIMLGFATTIGVILRDLLAEREHPEARQFWFLTSFTVAMSCQYVLAMSFNGLETGGQLLAYALVARFLQTHAMNSLKDAAKLGVLLGFVVLVRIDAVTLCFVVVGWMLFFRRHERGLLHAALVGIIAFAVSSPWWIYNVVQFGSLVPVSGQSESKVAFDSARIVPMLTSIAKSLSPWAYTSATVSLLVASLQLAVVAVITVLGIRTWRSLNGTGEYLERKRNLGSFIAVFVTTLALLVVVYFITSVASWFYWRYLAVASILSIGLTVLSLKWLSARRPRLVIVAIVGLAAWSTVYPVGSFVHKGNDLQTNQVKLVSEYVPDGERVASIQSGTLGFFEENVVNLDGKVNPNALKNRSRTGYFLRENEINWFADWTVLFPMILTGDPAIDEQWQLVSKSGNIGIWHFGPVEG